MAIDFKQFDELFAPAYQLTYISLGGHIDVGPNTYSVFHAYTMEERQIIFQVCQKYLPWQITEEQEQWERTMYMYQYIIKSPAPFPYPQYSLSEEIIMAITWTPTVTLVDFETKLISLSATRVDDTDPENIITDTYSVKNMYINSAEEKVAVMDAILAIRADELIRLARIASLDSTVTALEIQAKAYLEAQE